MDRSGRGGFLTDNVKRLTVKPEHRGHRAFAAAKTQGPPLRMAFLYAPNGVNVSEWFPRGEGRGYEFGPSMKASLEAHRNVKVILRVNDVGVTY